ncbi:MAG: hypothetical protein JNM31_06820 [Flavobacteriales bacterium]|nr:hypothetical protein [Flavobacteriales bacterium]
MSIGSIMFEQSYAVAVDPSGAVITVGNFVSTMDADPGLGVFNLISNGDADWFIQKLDANGQFLWACSLGSTSTDDAFAVTTDGSGNVIVSGRIAGSMDIDPGPGVMPVTTTNLSQDVLVLKLNASGGFVWGRVFGGLGGDAGRAVAVDGAGNVYTSGLFGNAGDIDPGPGVTTVGGNGQQDIFVQKLDPAGLFVWGVAMGGTANDRAHAMAVDMAGNVFVCGEFRNTVDFDPGPGVVSRTSGGAEDFFVLKMTSAGALLWAHGFGSTGSERANGMGVGPDGGPVITGRITSITDVDPGPGVFNLNGSNIEDAFVLKLDASGALGWAFLLSTFLNEGFDVDVDGQNNVYVTGTYGTFSSIPLDLDPGPGVAGIVNLGGGDVFVASYDPAGAFRWGFGLGSIQNDGGRGIAISPTGAVHVTGMFYQTIDLDPGPGAANFTSVGNIDVFTAKYDQPGCATGTIALRAFLQGPFNPAGQLMSDALRSQGLLPLTEPYTAMALGPASGPASTTGAVLGVTGPNAIVDWVLVELRDPLAPSVVLDRRAALIQRDGDVVDVDGISPVPFCDVHGQALHVALRHRNHLGVMTANTFVLGAGPIVLDLTTGAVPLFGADAQQVVAGTQVLWQGNAFFDGTVKYSGVSNDRDPILARIGGVVPTATVSGYWPEDVTLDGTVKYTGSGNDRDPILLTIGGSVPTTTRYEQLP